MTRGVAHVFETRRLVALLAWLLFAWLLFACSDARPVQNASGAKARALDARAALACAKGEDCDAGTGGNAGTNGNAVSTGQPGGKGLCTAQGNCEEALPVKSVQHMDGTIIYPDPPPVGGNHNPCWGAWGVHDQPLGVEHWVHNLEHGGVVFLYHCTNGCTSEVAQLADFVRGHRRTLLSQYDAMPKRFAVVAWGYRLQSDALDLSVFEAFYNAHMDHAPESIDSGPPSGCPQ